MSLCYESIELNYFFIFFGLKHHYERRIHRHIMADDLEEKPNTSHDFSSNKAALFEAFNKWNKWREEQLQEFRNRQLLGSQKLFQLSNETQKQFEKILKNGSTKCQESEEKPKLLIPECSDASISLNDLDNNDSLQDHSITGHLQRCFDDSSQSNISVNPNKVPSVVEKIPIFSEIRNPQFPAKNVKENAEQLVNVGVISGPPGKPKQPFLKKGTGLLRYMPKSAVNSQLTRTRQSLKSNNPSQKKIVHLPQKTLNLKPAIRKTDVPSAPVKHITFDIPLSDNEEKAESVSEDNSLPVSNTAINDEINNVEENNLLSSSYFEQSLSEDSKLGDTSNSENEKLISLKELEEFEMLENCAQNSSFNSDSSVVQRILHKDSNESLHSMQRGTMKPHTENIVPAYKEMPENSSENTNGKIGLSKCIEDIQARKQRLQKVISDINPRIVSLEKEITSSKQENFDDRDVNGRCSTPVDGSSSQEKVSTSTLPEDDPNNNYVDVQDYSSARFRYPLENEAQEEEPQCDCTTCNIDFVLNSSPNEGIAENVRNEGEESVGEILNEVQENEQIQVAKSKFQEKVLELEKEIGTYEELNAKLSSICKERDEILKKLQKERDDFNKYKESEKKKLEAEMQEERRQIKRQKETFVRYQKLRKDNPTRKERDEMNALRQEGEKLREELKRQKIKYTSDSRRWKSRIETAERERDTFKLENIKLEEQCQDLLAALKARVKKKPGTKLSSDEEDMQENIREIPICKDAATQTQVDVKDSSDVASKCSDTETARAEVHYNEVTEHEKKESNFLEDYNRKIKNHCTEERYPSEKSAVSVNYNVPRNELKDTESDTLSITVSVESEIKEIDHGNWIEKIFPSGEREIIYKSGTRKKISADGNSIKFSFYNGDVKEKYPDKQVYRYVSGVIETLFPDGLKISEFPNGQTQYHHPDGQKEIKFPDGTIYYISPNGSIDIHSANGKVINLQPDGTKVIEFANGQKETRTATYKRRDFPNGSVKIVWYDSGRQETRYPNGRIKIKDKKGKIIFDTQYHDT